MKNKIPVETEPLEFYPAEQMIIPIQVLIR